MFQQIQKLLIRVGTDAPVLLRHENAFEETTSPRIYVPLDCNAAVFLGRRKLRAGTTRANTNFSIVKRYENGC